MSFNPDSIQIDLNRFRDVFFEEATEYAADFEAALLALESTPDDLELLNTIFRCAHSIKGASSTFGLSDIAHFTHYLESLLERLRGGELRLTRELVDLLLRAVDMLRQLIQAAKRGEPAPAGMEALLTVIREIDPDDTPQAAPEPALEPGMREYRIRFAPGPDVLRQGMDPQLILRELAGIGEMRSVRVDTSALPALEALDPEACYLAWDLHLRTDRPLEELEDVFLFVADTSLIDIRLDRGAAEDGEAVLPTGPGIEPAAAVGAAPVGSTASSPGMPEASVPRASSPAPAGSAGAARPAGRGAERGEASPDSASIRVPTERVDKLIDLVGEVVIAQSMIMQLATHLPPEQLATWQEAIGLMERSTRELQERVMSVRMGPLGSIFGRFPRMVRDLASTFGKRVTLQIDGEETEIDKGVIERIGDPLTHLVRNALDHGLEPPEERKAKGKPETATLRLNAMHEGGSVFIEVSDDGRGLDTGRIRQKGIALGLIREDQNLEPEQIHALIFHPGFSTAAAVTDISGRGMGMDIVKKTIEGLNGSLQTLSTPGQGTRFRIKLPLTLAIMDGLIVRVGEQIYILPLTAIVESLRPRPEAVKVLVGGREVVIVREEPLALLRLHRMFNVEPRVTDPSRGLVVLLEHEGRRLGLMVDELLGQSQVVIKSLERNFRKIDGVMGATIMGDGHVALILDVEGLVRHAVQESTTERTASRAPEAFKPVEPARPRGIERGSQHLSA